METIGCLFEEDEKSAKKEVSKAAERGRSRARNTFAAVLGIPIVVLLFTSITFPPAGYAAFPGANGKILFVSDRDGNNEIYVMNADGTGQTRLTFNAANDNNPKWSPDSTKIVFTSDRDDPNYDIYVPKFSPN